MAAAGVATTTVPDSVHPLRTARARIQPAARPAPTPMRAPTPISRRAWRSGPLVPPLSPMRMATVSDTSGAMMPSLRPLSTLRARRIRLGTEAFVTMPAPRPASVGARHAAARTANQVVRPPKKKWANRAPKTTVSGSPIPSKRAGKPTSWRSDVSRRRAASEKRINTNVISAVSLMVLADKVMSKALSPPKTSPPAVNTIGAVMPARSAGAEMTAHSTTMAATIARSAHVTSYRLTGRNVCQDAPSDDPSTTRGEIPPISERQALEVQGDTAGTVKRSARSEGDADDHHRWNTEKQEA